jgi:hypothetical protein
VANASPSLSPDERLALHRMSLFFEKTPSTTREFFESLALFVFFEHLEGRETYLPFLGKLNIDYNGEDIEAEGKRARVKVDFSVSNFVRRLIGQEHDGVRTDAELILLNRLEKIFKSYEDNTFSFEDD